MSPILDIYNILYNHFGPQHWWPGDSPFEVVVGAVLTQNTNWVNVNKAIDTLKNDNLLSYESLSTIPLETLAAKIRPCGYYNLKAKRLKNLLNLIKNEFDDNLNTLLSTPLPLLRNSLLTVKGIGQETADAIILYAAEQATFVVDTYTHRILSRHNIINEECSDYHEIQSIFMDSLPEDRALFNEYHALIVKTGKTFCKKKNPNCNDCPLSQLY